MRKWYNSRISPQTAWRKKILENKVTLFKGYRSMYCKVNFNDLRSLCLASTDSGKHFPMWLVPLSPSMNMNEAELNSEKFNLSVVWRQRFEWKNQHQPCQNKTTLKYEDTSFFSKVLWRTCGSICAWKIKRIWQACCRVLISTDTIRNREPWGYLWMPFVVTQGSWVTTDVRKS